MSNRCCNTYQVRACAMASYRSARAIYCAQRQPLVCLQNLEADVTATLNISPFIVIVMAPEKVWTKASQPLFTYYTDQLQKMLIQRSIWAMKAEEGDCLSPEQWMCLGGKSQTYEWLSCDVAFCISLLTSCTGFLRSYGLSRPSLRGDTLQDHAGHSECMHVRGDKRVRVISWHNCGRSEGRLTLTAVHREYFSLVSRHFLKRSSFSQACWWCQPIALDLRPYGARSKREGAQ